MHAILHALSITGSMTWEITWALILGFALSAVVQAVVRKSTIVRLLGDDRPRTLALASALGAASSSCSYAAVALARSLFRKGANFTAAMAFEIASTNLVVELGVILALLMGWQFTAAEFVGGPIMIVVLAVLFRLFLRERLLRAAREQAEQGLAGSMEGHAAMDMSVRRGGSFARRLLSREGFTSVAHVFVMEWAAILRDLVVGLLIAGAIAAWVPDSFWQAFFFTHHPLAAKFWGPLIGPLVAVVSFVCSIGNVPLAVVLWKGGISFGGVIAFIFADLLILPILNIYRKYYGARTAAFLFATFYAAMVIAGYLVEFAFGGLGLIPDQRHAGLPMEGISWNYTTWLNIAFLLLAAALLVRFFRTGGTEMLRMMGGSPDNHHAGHGSSENHHHAEHQGHGDHKGHGPLTDGGHGGRGEHQDPGTEEHHHPHH
ncbi:permease [Kitasatospora sp. HPMI-4]|uniref:permease n=1 Tax=Kitasatospora sp. HPMI-4 TaxID=3448443 RepID=UPI003F1C7DBE